MTGNQRIAQRLIADFDGFATGVIGLPDIQHSINGNGSAIEGLGKKWHDLLNKADAELETIRFTQNESQWIPEGIKVLREMRKVLNEILST